MTAISAVILKGKIRFDVDVLMLPGLTGIKYSIRCLTCKVPTVALLPCFGMISLSSLFSSLPLAFSSSCLQSIYIHWPPSLAYFCRPCSSGQCSSGFVFAIPPSIDLPLIRVVHNFLQRAVAAPIASVLFAGGVSFYPSRVAFAEAPQDSVWHS